MRVLVTGLSGTIGGAVARALLRRGHAVLGTVRAEDRPVPDGATPVAIDLFQPRALRGLTGEVDAVVHAASSNDEHAATLDRAVVTTMLDALADKGKPFVYTSGLWPHGDSGDTPLTEDSPFAPPLVVSWRPDLERLVADARDVHTVRIRPGLAYGGGRGYVPMVLGPRDDGSGGKVVRHFGSGDNRWSVVHADDLGDLYALAVESAPAGSVYVGTLDESVRVRDAAKMIADAAGAVVRDWDPEDARRHWGVMVDAFLIDQVATSARARAELGWRPVRPSLLTVLGG
jgi:nucleoside-diphosphate-sugar epimerase